jgi:hypothetical protein
MRLGRPGDTQTDANETIYWMESLVEAGLVKTAGLESLMKEADELVAISVASINTARRRP